MNGFALDTNIVSAHLRGDAQVGARIKEHTRLYLPVTVMGAHEFVVELELHPHAGVDAEEAAQAQIAFRGAAAFALLH
jgi:predicted nucleic acid-binding protein